MSDCIVCGRPMRQRYRERDESFRKRVICSIRCALTRYERTLATEGRSPMNFTLPNTDESQRNPST